jgi:hypothetical protein
LEVVTQLPCGLLGRKALPLDEHVLQSTVTPGLQCSCRRGK